MAPWYIVRKNKKKALDLLHIYALQSGGLPKFKGKVNVTITRLWGKRQRAMDIENLYGAVKPLIDAMREPKKAGGRLDRKRGQQGGLGIIEDDDPESMGLTVHQQKNDGRYPRCPIDSQGTIITIEGRRTQ